MLRITVLDNENLQTIKLEGKVAGLWVAELDRVWRALTELARAKELHLDLRNVNFMDADGKKVLSDIYRRRKANFVTDSPLSQYFADEAMRNSPQSQEEGV